MVNFYEVGAVQTQSLKQESDATSRRRGGSARLAGWLALSIIGAALAFSAPAGQSMNLSWQGSSDPTVVGYNVYYGGSSGNYTNETSVSNVTRAVISSLSPGATYYFAATAVDSSGEESGFSTEISYTVPVTNFAQLQVGKLAGGLFALTGVGIASHTYQILASTNLLAWTVIGTQTADSTGSFQFTDTTAGTFPARFYRTLDTQQ